MCRAKFKAKYTVHRLGERGVKTVLLSKYMNVESGSAQKQQYNYYH